MNGFSMINVEYILRILTILNDYSVLFIIIIDIERHYLICHCFDLTVNCKITNFDVNFLA